MPRARRSPSCSSGTDEQGATSSSSSGGDRHAKKKSDQYSILESLWPRSQRPKELQSKKVINSMAWDELLALYKINNIKEKSNKGELFEKFCKDKRPPAKKYREAKDDRYRLLHAASFERLCVRDYDKWWYKTPTVREHVFRSIPLEFVGCQNTLADKTLTNMHDKKNVLAAKNFMAENVSVAAKPRVLFTGPDGTSSTDFAWETPTSMAQIQDAIATFGLVLHAIWPFDPTALIINKVLAKYRWFSVIERPATRVAAVTKFFDYVLRVNADRATNKRCIMSFKEQMEAAANILTNSGFNSALPFDKPGNQSGGQPAARNQQGGRDKNRKKPGRAEFENKGLCFNWNSMIEGVTCKNAVPGTDTCKDEKGRTFMHRCNMGIGKNKWCKEAHRRIEHK